jgi:hypothetical protein
VRDGRVRSRGVRWLTGLPLLVALALAGLSWLVSSLLAARRG